MDATLMKIWIDEGFAESASWNAYHNDWLGPGLEAILAFPEINPTRVDPQFNDIKRPKFPKIPLEFIEGEKIEEEEGHDIPLQNPGLFDDYQKLPQHEYSFQLMLQERQNIRRAIRAKQTARTWAAAMHNTRLVDVILRCPRININFQDRHNRTPLIFAVAAGNKEILKKILDREVLNINLQDDQRQSAILYAAQSGDAGIARLLMGTARVDLKIPDAMQRTALGIGKQEGHHGVAALLSQV